jgi:TonB family protein
MKTCPLCGEDVPAGFRFCPIDGNTFEREQTNTSSFGRNIADNSLTDEQPRRNSAVYYVTMLTEISLPERLLAQLREVSIEVQLSWPEFRHDPLCVGQRLAMASLMIGKSFINTPQRMTGMMAGLLLVLSVVCFIILISDPGKAAVINDDLTDQLVLTEMVEPIPEQIRPDHGIGASSKVNLGRVGFGSGNGEGSETQPKKATGGGGGGQQNQLPAQLGKPPLPSPIPASIPTLPTVRPPLLPTGGLDIDKALYKDLPYDRYGDPRSRSAETSSGPGTENGIGTGRGPGVGEGNDAGFGPGERGNIGDGSKSVGGLGDGGSNGHNSRAYNQTFSPKEVTQKARVLFKPEPQYTEEARRNQITGTVIVKAVLSGSGEVTNIRAITALPFGLTEKAIAAARQIRFAPAMKDGRAVSQWIQIEYNFNLY